MAHDVFISHSSKDKRVADATCHYLESRGIRCWVAPRDIRPGAKWGASIVKAIRASRVMVLIFSKHANASPQIMREVERAVNAGVVLIPMRIEEVLPEDDLDYFLSTAHWLDAFGSPVETHLGALLKAVREILVMPVSKRTPAENEPELDDSIWDGAADTPTLGEATSAEPSPGRGWMKVAGVAVFMLLLSGVGYAVMTLPVDHLLQDGITKLFAVATEKEVPDAATAQPAQLDVVHATQANANPQTDAPALQPAWPSAPQPQPQPDPQAAPPYAPNAWQPAPAPQQRPPPNNGQPAPQSAQPPPQQTPPPRPQFIPPPPGGGRGR